MSRVESPPQETVVHRYEHRERRGEGTAIDPITTEVVRHGLISAAEQMKRALVRTAFNPVIYEVLDFAVAIYDRDVRLLSQALGMQHFMGRLSFGVEASVAAVVMPVFVHDELIGYTAITAHWLDVGGKDPYSTDTVDVFQEGMLFPGVKLYRAGVVDDDLYRTLLANSRVPKALAGDLNAE